MGKGHSRGGHQGSVMLRVCCAESQKDKTQRVFLLRKDSIFRCRLLALFGPDRPGWRRLFLRVKGTARLRTGLPNLTRSGRRRLRVVTKTLPSAIISVAQISSG